jgi:hypothetical protein
MEILKAAGDFSCAQMYTPLFRRPQGVSLVECFFTWWQVGQVRAARFS